MQGYHSNIDEGVKLYLTYWYILGEASEEHIFSIFRDKPSMT